MKAASFQAEGMQSPWGLGACVPASSYTELLTANAMGPLGGDEMGTAVFLYGISALMKEASESPSLPSPSEDTQQDDSHPSMNQEAAPARR